MECYALSFEDAGNKLTGTTLVLHTSHLNWVAVQIFKSMLLSQCECITTVYPKYVHWTCARELIRYASTTTETLICPGWETLIVPVSQPGTPGRDKRGVLLSWVWQPGQKVLPAPRGWRTLLSPLVLPTGTKGLFFLHVFLFSIFFLFQLYFCISIKLMYWNLVCMISTNIYIYIVTYIIFVLDSFHI